MAPDTPVSLLERLRLGPDSASWQRLLDLYTPLIRNWLTIHTLQTSDADDLTQDTLKVVVEEVPNFRHNLRRGAFRNWLKSILINRLRIFWRERRPQALDHLAQQLEDPHSQLHLFWEREHDRHLAQRLLELIEPEFEPATWQAFRQLVLEEVPTATVAANLGISANAVRIAKSRVLARFRREIEGLVD